VIFLFRVFALAQDLIEFVFKLIQSGARDDHRIAPPMGRLGNLEKPSAFIFTQFDNKVLPLDRELTGLDCVFH
jgi:hypothetical protein